MNKKDYHIQYFKSISKGLDTSSYYINNSKKETAVFFKEIDNVLLTLFEKKGKIFFFGNGASAAFANHMALDFSKNGKILSRSLSDSALLTALSNDYSFEEAMTEYLKMEGVTTNDLVVTISSSGSSSNIIGVLEYCTNNHIKSLSLSGLKIDNRSIQLSDYAIFVQMKTYGIVECLHQIFLHLILDSYMNVFEWEKVEVQNMNSEHFSL